MSGYLFLLLALLSGSAKGYCGKRTSSYVREYKDALFANFVRMLLCIVISFGLVCVQGNISQLAVSREILLIALLSGIMTSVFVVSWLISVRSGAYMMLDVFLMLGVIVPLILSFILFGEEIRLNQWIGLIVLFAAVLIMCSYNNQIKEKIKLPYLLLLILCGSANGLADFSQKLFVRTAVTETAAVFNFYTYVFSAVILFLLYFIVSLKKTENTSDELKLLHQIGGYIFAMSVCLFANSFFKTLAAGILPAAKLYPLNHGAALIISSFMSRFFFKEKLTRRCIVGMILAFAALLIINLL